MSVDSFKHSKSAERPHTPSREEAGMVPDGAAARARVPLNPVVTRGQDPELWWLGKYPGDQEIAGLLDDLCRAKDAETREKAQRLRGLIKSAGEAERPALEVDIRNLYRTEHIAPERLIERLYRIRSEGPESPQLAFNELFGNALDYDELEKPASYYTHADGWTNRLIQGDSLLVMTSLLEREGLAGKVQMIYMDPPYGIKYGSNWQMRLGDRTVKDGDDAALSGEPEVIKAFRDTWELGIHSYLGYLRDRLLAARELLTESGSCFVQISDENVHLTRVTLDEVFGAENFVVTVILKKTSATVPSEPVNDYILWYAKDRTKARINPLYYKRSSPDGDPKFNTLVSPSGKMKRVVDLAEQEITRLTDAGWRWARVNYPIVSQDENERSKDFVWNGKAYKCGKNKHWRFDPDTDMLRLAEKNRLFDGGGKSLGGVLFWDDWPYVAASNMWDDLHGEPSPMYVVQTTYKAVQRCVLMTTNPGDLVFDPTCGSGTSAFVSENWGRRWITVDTSRIALNIAKQRMLTATFPWYRLVDDAGHDLRPGLVYKTYPRVSLRSLAKGEPPDPVTFFDQPEVDKRRLRVTGPFTVETLQSCEPLAPESLAGAGARVDDLRRFEGRVFDHLQSAGVKNGLKGENAVFHRIERLPNAWLHAEGYWQAADGERKAYLHIGPQFGAVSRQAVNEAVKECRTRGDAHWLVVLGFAFESDIANATLTQRLGSFELTKVRMHDDLLQEGLLKKDRKAASFVTIGEPDIGVAIAEGAAVLEVRGLDLYDPIHDQVKARNVADIAYWMVDDDYDGSNFIVRQVFFCGADDRKAFERWRKGLSDLASQSTRRKAERTLRIALEDAAWARLYGFRSHPIPLHPGRPRRAAVRVVSQFGEESTKVLNLG